MMNVFPLVGLSLVVSPTIASPSTRQNFGLPSHPSKLLPSKISLNPASSVSCANDAPATITIIAATAKQINRASLNRVMSHLQEKESVISKIYRGAREIAASPTPPAFEPPRSAPSCSTIAATIPRSELKIPALPEKLQRVLIHHLANQRLGMPAIPHRQNKVRHGRRL